MKNSEKTHAQLVNGCRTWLGVTYEGQEHLLVRYIRDKEPSTLSAGADYVRAENEGTQGFERCFEGMPKSETREGIIVEALAGLSNFGKFAQAQAKQPVPRALQLQPVPA